MQDTSDDDEAAHATSLIPLHIGANPFMIPHSNLNKQFRAISRELFTISQLKIVSIEKIRREIQCEFKKPLSPLCTTAWFGLHWQGSLRPTLTYFLSDRVRVISLITSVSAALQCQRKIGENLFTIKTYLISIEKSLAFYNYLLKCE